MTLARCGMALLMAAVAFPPGDAAAGPTMQDVLAASKTSDWRPLDPVNTLYLELPDGRVVIELAPDFAPRHVADIRTLLEVLRTDTPTFEALIESRRNRSEEWFEVPAGRIEICNVPLPVRAAEAR